MPNPTDDHHRFDGLHARYEALVTAYLTSVLPAAQVEDIEDLAQETWLRVWIRLPLLADSPVALLAVAADTVLEHQALAEEAALAEATVLRMLAEPVGTVSPLGVAA